MKHETFRVEEETWLKFKEKYGRQADQRLRELITRDLED